MESCVSSDNHDEVHASNLALFPISSTPFEFIHSLPFFGHSHQHRPTLSSKPISNFPFLMMAKGASDVAAQLQKSVASNVDRFLKVVDALRCQNAAFALDKAISLYSYLQNCFHFQIPRRGSERQNIILSNNNFAAILPGGDSVAGVVVSNGILNFLNIYNTLLIVRIVLTWFPNAPMAIVSPLSTICDPYLNVFRGIIPPLGGTLDLSPILAFLVLNAFTSTAAALPAELPPSYSQEANIMAPPPPPHSPVTSSQKKWIRRLAQSRDNAKSPPTGI